LLGWPLRIARTGLTTALLGGSDITAHVTNEACRGHHCPSGFPTPKRETFGRKEGACCTINLVFSKSAGSATVQDIFAPCVRIADAVFLGQASMSAPRSKRVKSATGGVLDSPRRTYRDSVLISRPCRLTLGYPGAVFFESRSLTYLPCCIQPHPHIRSPNAPARWAPHPSGALLHTTRFHTPVPYISPFTSSNPTLTAPSSFLLRPTRQCCLRLTPVSSSTA
jgi:hypothetical protein